MGEVIRQYYPDYYETFERLAHGRGTYFGNMMVCSKRLYDAYHMRVYGFISEFLLMVWAEVNGLKVYECKVGMTDEKRETAEMKERLAASARLFCTEEGTERLLHAITF